MSGKELLEIGLQPIKQPELIKQKSTSSENDVTLPKIVEWEELNDLIEKNFDSSIQSLPSDKCFKYTNIIGINQTLHSEEEYRFQIFNILNSIFNNQLLKNTNIRFKYQRGKEDTDLHLSDDKNKRLINIEIKTEEVLTCLKEEESLYSYFIKNSENDEDKKSNQNPINCIKQVFRYMEKYSCCYSVLTTFNRSWLFKLNATRKELLISKTIEYDFFLKAIYFLISSEENKSIKRKWQETSDELVTSNTFSINYT